MSTLRDALVVACEAAALDPEVMLGCGDLARLEAWVEAWRPTAVGSLARPRMPRPLPHLDPLPLPHPGARAPDLGALGRSRAATWRGTTRSSRTGPLHGWSVAAKDNLAVAGRPWTAGSALLAGRTAGWTADVVARVADAGGRITHGAAMDAFAMGVASDLAVGGPVGCLDDVHRSPGGSSGGSAALVRGRVVDLALGSDTGGSVRVPAALCGVVGFKPSRGVLSRRGLIPLASALDEVGLFGLDVAAVAHLLEAVGEVPRVRSAAARPVRVGLVPAWCARGAEAPVREALGDLGARVRQAGAVPVVVDVEGLEGALRVYQTVVAAGAASDLARFVGLRHAPPGTGSTWRARAVRLRTERLGPEVRRRVVLGTWLAGPGRALLDDAWAQQRLLRRLDAVLADVDVLAGPTCPRGPWRHGALSEAGRAGIDRYVTPASLADLPAVSVPVADGVGLQLVGRRGADAWLLGCAARFALRTPRAPWP